MRVRCILCAGTAQLEGGAAGGLRPTAGPPHLSHPPLVGHCQQHPPEQGPAHAHILVTMLVNPSTKHYFADLEQ